MITKAEYLRALSTVEHPVHLLYDRETPRVKGWPDADLHARKAGDRVVNSVLRLSTPFVGAFAVTKKAAKLPQGWQKAAVVPAPFIGLVGGTVLGSIGFCADAVHVFLHLGGSAGNVLYAVGYNTFESAREAVDGMHREAEAFVEEAHEE